jgi:hypothetical protein
MPTAATNTQNPVCPACQSKDVVKKGRRKNRLHAVAHPGKCALTSHRGNSGEIGDIYRIPPNLWLVQNEVGGWTAMYPEGY